MSEAVARTELSSFESRLRAFVARRVREGEVDDVVQDVFLRLTRGVGALEDEQRFEAWVYRVARSAIVDQYRARLRQGGVDDPVTVEPPAETDDESAAERELAGYVAVRERAARAVP